MSDPDNVFPEPNRFTKPLFETSQEDRLSGWRGLAHPESCSGNGEVGNRDSDSAW